MLINVQIKEYRCTLYMFVDNTWFHMFALIFTYLGHRLRQLYSLE